MSDQVYKDMVGIMSQRGMAFGGMDIPEFYDVVEELFTPEEAAINNAMPKKTFTAADLAMGDGDSPQIELKRCFGCAVCATGCTSDAIKMVMKAEFEAPPKDQKALMEAAFTSLSNMG